MNPLKHKISIGQIYRHKFNGRVCQIVGQRGKKFGDKLWVSINYHNGNYQGGKAHGITERALYKLWIKQ